jgi:hypothetical protein
MPRLLPLAVLAAAGAGCVLDFSTYVAPDETVCGVEVTWGPQRDRDLCPIVALCPEGADGARVEFQADVTAACLRQRVAGCFDPNADRIYLTPAEPIGATAALHEFKHRALWLAGADLDYGHTGAEWDDP